MARRRKFWGWGFEDQQPSHEAVEATAAGAREHLGFGPAEVERPVRLEDLELPASAARAARLARARSAGPIPTSAPRTRTGSPTATSCARSAGRFDNPPDVGGPSRGRGGARARARLVRGGGRGGDPVRRRHERGRRGGASGRSGPTVSIDLRAMDRVLEVDCDLARRADPGGGHRAAPRGAAARARPHAAALPAVVRVLDAGRLDRHARGRPLRDACTRTSTTSSSRSGRSRRAAGGRAGGCPARAPGRAPTAC